MRFAPSMTRLLTAGLSAVLAAGAWAAGDKLAVLESERDRIAYSLGYQIGQDFKRQGVELRTAAVTKGFNDALSGASPLLAAEQMRRILGDLKRKITAQESLQSRKAAAKAQAEEKEFFEQNAKKQGVVVLPSGLQYKVLEAGTGKRPGLSDTVSVKYRASLINGIEFDSSDTVGKPASFAVQEVIPGWREGLQLMKEGAHYELFIPANLGYSGRGPLVDKAVILDVQLLKVQ